MPGRRVSHGQSKLCHKKFSGSSSFPFLSTRFPDSKSWAVGFCADRDALEDQMELLVPLRITRVPWSVTFKTPNESVSGISLLPTHTTVGTLTFLYHIPRYRFLELPGWKKPSSKLPPAETMVSPSLIC
ncbi:unnamed protein product, partial [Vitis vinifera]